MKNKKYLLLAATAALFAACSSDDANVATQEQAPAQQVEVAFDTYVNRGTTRAGSTGDITNTGALQSRNFGIFAYYTNSDTYDPIYVPNFMYNQKVSHDTKWSYTPVKYWPNEYITANAEENDKVSFFAYAPWVDCTPSTGKISDDKDFGIVGFTRNTAAGDPMVKYNVSFDLAKQVDLLWGVCPQTTWDIQNGKMQTKTVGKPWLNVEHPRTLNQKLTFNFNHALSRLIVTVDLYANAATATAAAAGTKVFIRSVTFSGFSTTGTLNLNNAVANKPLWLSNDGLNDIESGVETTIKDGRKDGKEGVFAASNEKDLINPSLTQTAVWDVDPQPGVTATAVNLFNTSAGTITATDPIYVIPNGDKLNVTIVYDVLTKDDRVAGYLNDGVTHGSVVTNTVSKTVQISSTDVTLEPLKKYTVNLHIGLKEVVVDATINDWDDGGTGAAGLPTNP